MHMAKQWFVVHTYSGYENKVKELLEERVKAYTFEEAFGDILVPAEDVEEIIKIKGLKGEKKVKTSSRKFFPGYLLVQMDLNNETWHLVRNTPKVTGFIGGKNKPIPIPDEAVNDIIQKIKEGKLRPKPKVSFEKGDSVLIVEGPFANFNGTVEDVKPEKARLKVLVSIFGRPTPIELEFAQVKKN
jgi:transcription termination/antitermination protein NusG